MEGAFDRTSLILECAEQEKKRCLRIRFERVKSSLCARIIRASEVFTIWTRAGLPLATVLEPDHGRNGLRKLKKVGFYIQTLADDGVILVRGRFIVTVGERMKVSGNLLRNSAQEERLSVNPGKTELVMFNRRKQQDLPSTRLFGGNLQLKSRGILGHKPTPQTELGNSHGSRQEKGHRHSLAGLGPQGNSCRFISLL